MNADPRLLETSPRESDASVSAVLARRLKPLRDLAPGQLMIHEIYRSVQGESTFQGLPCVFIRLTACHLRCSYCDTPHAFHEGKAWTVAEVVRQTLALGDDLVEVTGGEPLLQSEALSLMTRLADAGKTVLLETSGSLDISSVDPRVRIILDIKTPASGESGSVFWANLARLKPIDEVKFVICDREDFDWAIRAVRDNDLLSRCPVIVSPAFGRVAPEALADWILESGSPLRMQLQLHKAIWGAIRRGV